VQLVRAIRVAEAAPLNAAVKPTMSHVREMIELLRKRADVGVVEQEQSWSVVIRKGRDLFCEITVPHDVLEWSACVKRREDNREVWSDWMDYSGYDDRPKDDLEAQMADDILAFIDRVSVSELVLPLRIYEARA
jgi:hypothetical protein